MEIKALKCLNCGDIIYSRAHHDFRSCSCEKDEVRVSIDGGFDYCKVCYGPDANYEWVNVEVNATKRELYDDWNNYTDAYGLIKPDSSV